MSENILFLGNKIFEIPPFFQARPGDLDKKVHACSLRFSALNTIPTLRELETRLNGAKFFSHLDMNDGYMQLELAEESRKLATFYTHRRLKHFKRLHFGVNSAAKIFNKEVRKVVSLEPNAISIYNDVLVFGATQEEHD